jgi:hypothetical protein
LAGILSLNAFVDDDEPEDPEADREDGGDEKRTGFHRFDSFT